MLCIISFEIKKRKFKHGLSPRSLDGVYKGILAWW
jgi:hypothetical protein